MDSLRREVHSELSRVDQQAPVYAANPSVVNSGANLGPLGPKGNNRQMTQPLLNGARDSIRHYRTRYTMSLGTHAPDQQW